MFCMLASAALTLFHYLRFLRSDFRLPAGVSLAGVPVGQLHAEHAIAQLKAIYATPVTLRYGENVFQIKPQRVEFIVDGKAMLQDLSLPGTPARFWDTLRGREQPPAPQDIALQARFSREKLRIFLEDVASRYDRPVFAPWSDPGQLVTVVSPPAQLLQIDASLPVVEAALLHPTERSASRGAQDPDRTK